MSIERIRQDLADSETIVYCFRHQESLMNALGYGNENSPLTNEGRSKAGNVRAMIDTIGIDRIITGNILRHVQTLDELRIPEKIPVIQDEKLNAIVGGYLFEEPDKRKVEERYKLSRFKADETGLYHASEFVFDPEREQIFPFGIYCSAIVDRRLRELVFGEDDPLTPFEDIEKRVKDFQTNLRKKISSDRQSTLACIGSCSSLGFIYEFAKYGTIGENIVDLETRDSRLYPQGHEEFSVLYLNPNEERMRLHLARQPIKDYLDGKDD
jgi:hypothetical protein